MELAAYGRGLQLFWIRANFVVWFRYVQKELLVIQWRDHVRQKGKLEERHIIFDRDGEKQKPQPLDKFFWSTRTRAKWRMAHAEQKHPNFYARGFEERPIIFDRDLEKQEAVSKRNPLSHDHECHDEPLQVQLRGQRQKRTNPEQKPPTHVLTPYHAEPGSKRRKLGNN